MTKEDVNMILVLSEGKRPIRNIAEAVGRSVGTVCAVRKTGSFSAYKSMIHERNMKIKRPRKETPQPSVKGQEDVVIAIKSADSCRRVSGRGLEFPNEKESFF